MSNINEGWNVAEKSNEFLQKAQGSNKYLSAELRKKAKSDPSYQLIHDQELAKIWVYNRLHKRDYLETKQMLIDELKKQISKDFTAPINAYDAEFFLEERIRILERTLNEIHDK